MQAPLNRMLILNFSSVVGKKNSLNCVKLFLPFLMLSDIAKGAKVARWLLSLQSPLRHGVSRRSVGWPCRRECCVHVAQKAPLMPDNKVRKLFVRTSPLQFACVCRCVCYCTAKIGSSAPHDCLLCFQNVTLHMTLHPLRQFELSAAA